MKPTIGISCGLWAEKEEWIHQGHRTYDHVRREYYQMVESRGGLPFLIPNVDQPETLVELLQQLDGLLLSGGDDIDPSFYGETNLFKASIIHYHRDQVELELARHAADMGMPTLGICRGMQVINVAFGGTCWQDTSLRPGTIEHKSTKPHTPLYHDVRIKPDTELAKIVKEEILTVSSVHHQHIKDIASDFTASAEASDGIVEAIEQIADRTWILGLQWHPETHPENRESQALMDAFLRECGLRS